MTRRDLTFRVFVSSTFSDLIAERYALQEHVFPRLRGLCHKHGARFQAIDLRFRLRRFDDNWGYGGQRRVSEEASLDQQTMITCLQELKRCQQFTPRPNSIVLLGDRYGWRPLPENILSAQVWSSAFTRSGPAEAGTPNKLRTARPQSALEASAQAMLVSGHEHAR